MKFLNRITGKLTKVNYQTPLVNGMYAVQDSESTPFVRGDSKVRELGGIQYPILGELLPSNVVDRFAFMSDQFYQDSNLFDKGQISSLLFFDNPEILELTEFEQTLVHDIYHLEEICQRPTLDLKYTEYKTPVSRARRISNHALTYLAGHSEDWHSQTFTGVKPNKILALHREDNWNTYENLAVKNLINHLQGNTHGKLYASHREVFQWR